MDSYIKSLIYALQSSEMAIREEAVVMLGRLGDTVVLPHLLQCVYDPEPQISERAVEAVGRILIKANPELSAALEDADAFAHEKAPEAIPSIVPHATTVLMLALRTTKGFVQQSVIEALSKIGPAAIPALLEPLHDPDGFVRGAAAEALGRIGDLSAVSALIQMLRDPHSYVQQCAARALSRYGVSVIPTLLTALDDPHSRVGVVEALGRIGDPSVAPALLQTMQGADSELTFACHLAFKRIGAAARPYLHDALKDEYEFTRANAAAILGTVGNQSDVPVLLEALLDQGRFGRVRSSAAYSLGRFHDTSALPMLKEALHDKHEIVRAGAAVALGCFNESEIIPVLIEVLADSSLSVRQKALNILSERDSTAIPALENALLDPREAIRVGAATALHRIHQDEDLPRRLLLLNVSATSKAAALEALVMARYPIPAPKTLCKQFENDVDPQVRHAASDLLRTLEPASVPAKGWLKFNQWLRKAR